MFADRTQTQRTQEQIDRNMADAERSRRNYEDDKQASDSRSDGDASGLIFLAVIGAFIYFVSWAIEKVSVWQSLDLPYNLVAGFYHYTVALPIQTGTKIWAWSSSQGFTQYPNLNLLISIILIVSIVLSILFLINKALDYFDFDLYHILLIMITPAVLGGFWYLLMLAFDWILATK